jgi:hypothetical protein
MSQPEPTKRSLKFENTDAMLAEARSLLETGYESRGNWTLGQACGHIADWMRYPMDGFPRGPLPIRCLLWAMKHTIGPGMKRKIFAEGFRGGLQTAPQSIPDAAEVSDGQGLEKLQKTVERVSRYDGPLHPSPLFGAMDKETLIKLTLLHAEHHLGYLEPKS